MSWRNLLYVDGKRGRPWPFDVPSCAARLVVASKAGYHPVLPAACYCTIKFAAALGTGLVNPAFGVRRQI